MMMMRYPGSALVALSLLLAGPPVRAAGGPADLLPKEALLVAEAPRGGATVDAVLGSVLWRTLLESDAHAAAREGPDYAKFTAGIALLQGACGTDFPGVARALLGKRAAVALVADTGRKPSLLFVFVSELDDAVAAESVLAGIEAVARMSRKEALPPAETRAGAEIRAIAPDVFRARSATHVVIAPSADLVAAALERAGGGAAESGDSAPRSAGDLEITLRPGADPSFLEKATHELGGAFLFGGYVSAIRSAPLVRASVLLAGEKGLEISVRAPAPDDGAFFPKEAPVAQGLPAPRDSLGSFRLRRDLEGFWNLRETLLDVKSISGAAQFAGFMAILFSGKDFGDDILPRFGPDVEFVAARQEFQPGAPRPKTPVPAFAAIFRLRDAASFGPLLEVGFQTALGVANADRGQKGMMPLLLRTESVDGGTVVSGRLVASSSGDAADDAWNYSPAAAFAGDRFILASTVGIARDLVSDRREAVLGADGPRAGDALTLSGKALGSYLREIEESLVAKSRLEKGHDEAAARRETRILVSLAALVERLDVAVRRDGGELLVEARASVAAPDTTGAPR